MKFEMIFSTSI